MSRVAVGRRRVESALIRCSCDLPSHGRVNTCVSSTSERHFPLHSQHCRTCESYAVTAKTSKQTDLTKTMLRQVCFAFFLDELPSADASLTADEIAQVRSRGGVLTVAAALVLLREIRRACAACVRHASRSVCF